MKKHIICLGDSNTHGYCADPADCADHGDRFNESERWTCLLQEKLGSEYLVLEEGLSGRTTVFPDPLHESMPALDVAYPILMSHEPVDLLVIMLGTNDTKERLNMSPACIALGMNRLIDKCKSVPCWGKHAPNILVVCPPHIGEEMEVSSVGASMGRGCAEKSRQLAAAMEPIVRAQNCAWLDAEGIAEFNKVDYMHLTRKGHADLAEKLAQIIPELV
ncbi:MAG: lipolytic enzyme, G-D-S-L [Oscillospiraceae bacterium]|nr:lipolytic enzyme, G-D-S-L [Oscillospiraceae bacterium]